MVMFNPPAAVAICTTLGEREDRVPHPPAARRAAAESRASIARRESPSVISFFGINEQFIQPHAARRQSLFDGRVLQC